MSKILVSACLIGRPCAYDGKDRLNDHVLSVLEEHEYMAICPEIEGGLSCPREPSEISGGNGADVIKGKATVITSSGQDNTEKFLKGAREALKKARDNGVKIAILKAKSPSCGCRQIYDGSFSGILKEGSGVTAALLEKNGIKVINESEAGGHWL